MVRYIETFTYHNTLTGYKYLFEELKKWYNILYNYTYLNVNNKINNQHKNQTIDFQTH